MPEQREPLPIIAPAISVMPMGVKGRVESLLSSLPGVQYVASKDAESCCGAGGSFCLEHPTITQAIAAEKIKNAQSDRGLSMGHWMSGMQFEPVGKFGSLLTGFESFTRYRSWRGNCRWARKVRKDLAAEYGPLLLASMHDEAEFKQGGSLWASLILSERFRRSSG